MKSTIYILLLLLVCNLEQVQAQAYEKYEKSIYHQSVLEKGKRLEVVPFPSNLSPAQPRKDSANFSSQIPSQVLLYRIHGLDIARAELAKTLEAKEGVLRTLPPDTPDGEFINSIIQLKNDYDSISNKREYLMTELGKSLTNSSFFLWCGYAHTHTFSDLFSPKEEKYVQKWAENPKKLENHYKWRSVNLDSIKIIDNVSIQGLTDRGVFYSELFEDAFNTVQPFRVSLGTTVVSTKGDSTGEKQSVQKILSGGGNFSLNFSTPLLYGKTPHISVYSDASLRFAGDLPIANSISSKITGNISPTLNLYASVSTKKQQFNFFGNVRSGVIIGTNDFYENLGIKNGKFTPIYLVQSSFGITLEQRIKIFFNAPLYSNITKIWHSPVIVGVQLLR